MKHQLKQFKIMVTLDFSRPRLRVNGKSVDKFSVASLIDAVKPYANAVISMDAFNYGELFDWLKKVLDERNYCDIYGETYNVVALR